MLKRVIFIVGFCAIAAGIAHAQSTAQPIDMNDAAQSPRITRQDKDVIAVMALWPGNFDNREQVQIDADMGRPVGTHMRLHSAVRRVDLPRIGSHVVYVEDYRDNDTRAIFRHGLLVISADETAKAVRVKHMAFVKPNAWVGAINNPSQLAAITPNDVAERQGCDILLHRDGDGFSGSTNPHTCQTTKAQGVETQLRLTADAFWFREKTINPSSGKTVSSLASFEWHQLERARVFLCMIDPPRSMVSATRDKPGDRGYVVRIHDQGGTFTFTHADGRTLFMSLRNTWSYNMNRKTLVVTLQENNEDGAGLGYAWTEPGADRIGMNPLWIHIQCDLDTPENLDMQRRMRNVL